MLRKIILLSIAISLGGMGCVTGPLDHHVEEFVYQDGKVQKFTYSDKSYGEKRESAAFLGAIDILRQADPMALPELEGLPVPGVKEKKPRAYTGVIKNKTGYDLSVPSSNSSAALTVPAHGWIEYTVWSEYLDLTAYRDGQPFYCLKIHARLKKYPFMCKKYDFVAEIVKAEPVPKKVYKKRRIKKRAPKDEGVEGLG
ncbi:MAG: hypothetical protein ABIG94_05225 [Pseudomonadota bacterium]